MADVDSLLERSIATEGDVIEETTSGKDRRVDLSQIDFDALKAKFALGRKRTEAERLKGTINSKLLKMITLNRTRADYLQKFQAMIDEYNAGSVNVEEFFAQLVTFARAL